MKTALKFLIILASLSFGTAHGAKLDLSTQAALIEKLESLIKIPTDDTESRQNMILRLADLHSEQARLLAMDNEGKGDQTNKKEILNDRVRAIELYNQGFKAANNSQKGVILLQTAHLEQLNGNEKKSKKLFDQIIDEKKKYDTALVAQAYIELGDYEVSHQHFEKGLKNFEAAQKIPDAPRKGYTQYRIAWCNYHQGERDLAIRQLIAVLKNKDLSKKADGSFDASFQEETSRDLATFMAQKDLKQSDIQTLIDLSPENIREANLTYLAGELDRSGHKKSALMVLAIIGDSKESAEDKLEGQIKITKIQYDLGKKKETINEIEKSAKLIKEISCKDQAQCDSLRQQLRKVVTDWGKAEEREPSRDLIAAYKVYASYFPDIEINYWAAIASEKTKQYPEAFGFYKNAAELTYSIKDKSDKSGIDTKKIFEGSLLGAIGVAELSKNLDLRDQAYEQYLRLNPNGEKALEVQYQIAHVTLDKGDNASAANQFYSIALSNHSGSDDVKNKSADLALDTLVLLKDDARLEKWSIEFANHFPKRKLEFLAINRKTILNHAANVINDSKSQSELQDQFDKLSKTDLSTASADERIHFHQNRSLIAVKLRNLDAIIASSTALLKEKSLPAQGRQEALASLAWAYEMKFNFAEALKIQKEIQPARGQEDEHVLKLAMLSELAHKDPTPFYEKYLNISHDKAKRQQVAFNLVRLAKNKTRAFARLKNVLAGNTQLYLSAGLFAFDETRSASLMRDLLSQKHSLSTFEGQLLARSNAIQELDQQASQVERSRLRTTSNSSLKKSIQERLGLLANFEKTTQRAISKQDWTLQFLSLSVLGQEYQRLGHDLLKLPMPRGLNKNQKQQYTQLIQQQVAPYTDKAKEISKKIVELWDKKDDSSFADVVELSQQLQSPGTKLAQAEVSRVERTARALKFSTQELAKKWQQRQKLSLDLKDLQVKAQKYPFDSSYLQKMKDLEKQLGRGPMVAYLDARLSTLKTGTGGQN